MRELIARNALTPELMVSCIFTLTSDLDAQFPAVAARPGGARSSAAAVRPGGGCPRLDANGDPSARPLRHAVHATCPSTLTLGMRARCEPISTLGTVVRAMAIEFTDRIRRIPCIPWPRATTSEPIWRCSRRTSRASRPPAVVEAAAAVIGVQTGTPIRRTRPRRALSEALRAAVALCWERIVRHSAGGWRGAARAGAEVVYAWPAFERLSAPRRCRGGARDRGPARCRRSPSAGRDGG